MDLFCVFYHLVIFPAYVCNEHWCDPQLEPIWQAMCG